MQPLRRTLLLGVIVNNMMIKDESKTFILIKNTLWVVIKFQRNKM
jgi:hypothetical protein